MRRRNRTWILPWKTMCGAGPPRPKPAAWRVFSSVLWRHLRMLIAIQEDCRGWKGSFTICDLLSGDCGATGRSPSDGNRDAGARDWVERHGVCSHEHDAVSGLPARPEERPAGLYPGAVSIRDRQHHLPRFRGLARSGALLSREWLSSGKRIFSLSYGEGRSVDASAFTVSTNTFGLLRVKPALGRDFVQRMKPREPHPS